MKILLSPAKSLNTEKIIPTKLQTEPLFLDKTVKIHKILQKKSPKQLADLMHISDKLADLNWQRFQNWKLPMDNTRQAVYTFDGDVYDGLDMYSIDLNKLDFLQENVRILSGFYGILKPLDEIMPYRLEMGTKIAIGKSKNLYEFWKATLTQHLTNELSENEVVVNLASKEYFDVIDTKKLKNTVIVPEFKDYKNGELKMISFFAKKARGLMTRFIINENITNYEDLKLFSAEGYHFDNQFSTNTKFVFTR